MEYSLVVSAYWEEDKTPFFEHTYIHTFAGEREATYYTMNKLVTRKATTLDEQKSRPVFLVGIKATIAWPRAGPNERTNMTIDGSLEWFELITLLKRQFQMKKRENYTVNTV